MRRGGRPNRRRAGAGCAGAGREPADGGADGACAAPGRPERTADAGPALRRRQGRGEPAGRAVHPDPRPAHPHDRPGGRDGAAVRRV